METLLTKSLGLRFPIVSAPLGRGSSASYLGALADAGSMGFVALLHMKEDKVASELEPIIQRTAGRFGVNLTLVADQRRRLATALELGVKNVSVWQGVPDEYVSQAKRAGANVFWTVRGPDEARRARELGVDFIVCQGREAGGHLVGEAPLMSWLPVVVDAANGVPVLAAGGIADGRGLAAALALGASGAWMGTRFVASEESNLPDGYKRSVVKATASDLLETTLFDGGWPDSPHRVIRNETVAAWEAAGCPPSGARPGEGDIIATPVDEDPVRRYAVSTPWSGMGEAWSLGPFYAGMSATLIDGILPIREILARTTRDAEAILANVLDHLKTR
ncbi:nitronate monooxygenase family protein [Paraburkholderia sp. BL21I4N1]|uniref:NAD(P)H-dependent flavin oxidoreductase n=1 Tax=Paraburkholderia sp. BL21I4N1 TaxID=1938801 RepID=UPI000D4E1C73|nr:nitronate monooxygenase [Paraburkholderia sp. BL21I4N1]PQV44475.1 nitronate monooxygenase [Paraburkholderia sp. BL21I4N1]